MGTSAPLSAHLQGQGSSSYLAPRSHRNEHHEKVQATHETYAAQEETLLASDIISAVNNIDWENWGRNHSPRIGR